MEKSTNDPEEQKKTSTISSEEQKKTTDPQEQEKDGNIFGKAADALFGNAEGGGSLSEEEGKDPDKQGSIKQ